MATDSLDSARLAFLDVETTGLSPAMGDRVVELGMIACQGTTEISRFSHLVNPGRATPSEAQQVHGISDQDVSDCPPFKEIAEEVGSLIADAWIVGHNVRFPTALSMFLITGLFRPASPNRSFAESVPNLIHHLVGLSMSSRFLLPEQGKLLTRAG